MFYHIEVLNKIEHVQNSKPRSKVPDADKYRRNEYLNSLGICFWEL